VGGKFIRIGTTMQLSIVCYAYTGLTSAKIFKIDAVISAEYTRSRYHKTFYIPKLEIFIMSKNVWSLQAFPVRSIASGQGQEPTLVGSTQKVFHLGRLLLCQQTPHYPGKACKG
jgi:hypothetical protein